MIHSKLLPLVLLPMLLVASCASPRPTEGPGDEVLTVGESTSSIETIAILGTNDIHGNLAPQSLKTREPEGQPSTSYEAAGASVLAAYVKVLRDQFGSRLLWLDGGDEFQGTIESNSAKGAPMVQFFNATGLQAAAIGNHEFDYGPENDPSDRLGALKARMSEAKYPYLSANIIEKKTGKLYPFPNTHPSVMLQVGRLKVGVVGLSTLETPHSTLSVNIRALAFKGLTESALEQAKSLRAAGAQLVVLDAHVGLRCAPGKASTGHQLRKATDPLGECGPDDEMVRLLESVPQGTFDAVVSGHSHQVVHHWVAGTPVIQGGASGRYTNVIYLSYDLGKQQLLHDRTRIEGPIPVCAQVFQNQNDCNGDRPAPKNGRGPLVTPRFHGQAIRPDADIATLLQPVFDASAARKKVPVAQAARAIEHQRFKESPLGNLVADAVRQEAKANFSVVNSGGIRAPMEAGTITYGAVFQSLPFDNSIAKLKLTGKEVKLLYRVAESGSRGFPSFSGLKLKVLDPTADAPSTDLDGDKKIEPWEINRLRDIRTSTGEPIRDDRWYTVATIDFLVLGGDDFKWVMSQIPADRVDLSSGTPMREVVAKYLEGKTWNTAEAPLVNPADPRLVFEMPKAKGKKGKKATKRGKRRR